jgi:hypothetical protein
MFKLAMVAFLGNYMPSIILYLFDNLSNLHGCDLDDQAGLKARKRGNYL